MSKKLQILKHYYGYIKNFKIIQINVIYTIALIISSNFRNLKFLILAKIDNNRDIKKIMIFFNNIKKNLVLKIYLQIFLLNNLKNRSNNIIKSFTSILEAKTKTN